MAFGQEDLLTPVRARTRIQSLDVIRGVAVLGILAVNADGFAVPRAASLHPAIWPYGNHGLTAICYWVMDTFFHEKFVTLFSMLFGVSLYLVGGERSDAQRGRLLWRRLGALFLFGMLHGFGIWWGDILSLYAVTGVPMAFCRSWRPRALLVVGLSLYVAMALRPLASAVVRPSERVVVTARTTARMDAAATGRIPGADQALLARRERAARAESAEARSSWAGAYRVNTRAYETLLAGDRWLVPSTLGLMMVGLSLFKSGFLAGKSSVRRYAAVAGAGAASLGFLGWLAWRKDVVGTPLFLGDDLSALLAPTVALGYASALILLLRAGAKRLLLPFAAPGRMAFTNYLTQSLIMTSIFYGGRGAMMGEVNRPALWGIVVSVWALQLAWSPLWLSRFEMGPFEWVWRCLTYGRRVPFLRQT